MKKIKIISAILAIVILITSLNLGMMFTSFAVSCSTIDEIRTAVNNASAGATIEITLKNTIDGGSAATINAAGKTVKFNGAGYRISNVSFSGGGLFSEVGEGSTFTKLGMYNCIITDSPTSAKSGYGLLVGKMLSGSITKCFAAGTIAVYGNASCIGGLAGEFGGSMSECFAMTDIYTDGSYVGGLIGKLNYVPDPTDESKSNSVTNCYSTGSIDTDSRNYIGGLIGYSDTSDVTNSYTSCCILNPYADTVKAIGVIPELSSTVYYDKNLSLQRQGDLDTANKKTAEDIAKALDDTSVWANNKGYYPQLVAFAGGNNGFGRVSALSAVVVDINLASDYSKGTGREYTVVSNSSGYTYADLTNNRATGNNQLIDGWRIIGGTDEYYFDPDDIVDDTDDTTGDSDVTVDIPTNTGGNLNGSSGNLFDVNTGRYLFVNTGDVKFTAYSDAFERDIYVHVTTSDKTPYISGGNGSASSPFVIDNEHELDMIRLFCIDETAGDYTYSINADIALTKDWNPISGMKGTLAGNNKVISDMTVNKDVNGNSGFIADSSVKLTVSNLHISEASVNAGAEFAGILIGEAKNATISNVFATGSITGAQTSGMIAGKTDAATSVTKCASFGISESANVGGGIVGTADGTVTDCYSTAVIRGASTVSGIIGNGSGTLSTSLFTGMLESAPGGTVNGLAAGDVVINAGCYYDKQSVAIIDDASAYARTTRELTVTEVSMGSSWTSSSGKYPQITVFTSASFSQKTNAASAFAAIPVFYKTSADGDAISIAFATADYNTSGYYGENVADTPTMSGYTYSASAFAVSGGGTELISLTDRDAFDDTRYLLFDVKNLTIQYRFNYESSSKDDYTDDMSGMGLAGFTTQLDDCYNYILDSSVTEYSNQATIDLPVYIRAATRALSLDITNPYGYSKTKINAYYKNGDKYVEIIPDDDGMVSISGIDTLYIEYVIKEPEISWGIYNIDCN